MPVRRKVVDRSADGRKLVVVAGDPLPWKYDKKEDAYFHKTKDGVAVYAVRKDKPDLGTDRFGNKLYRYWRARAMVNGETVNLGDTYMIALEGREVCEIYESSRLEPKALPNEPLKLDQS